MPTASDLAFNDLAFLDDRRATAKSANRIAEPPADESGHPSLDLAAPRDMPAEAEAARIEADAPLRSAVEGSGYGSPEWMPVGSILDMSGSVPSSRSAEQATPSIAFDDPRAFFEAIPTAGPSCRSPLLADWHSLLGSPLEHHGTASPPFGSTSHGHNEEDLPHRLADQISSRDDPDADIEGELGTEQCDETWQAELEQQSLLPPRPFVWKRSRP